MITNGAIVTSERDKALCYMQHIRELHSQDVLQEIVGKLQARLVFKNGSVIRWIRPVESSRGYRYSKLWCDKDIPHDMLCEVILPCYRGKREDIIWI